MSLAFCLPAGVKSIGTSNTKAAFPFASRIRAPVLSVHSALNSNRSASSAITVASAGKFAGSAPYAVFITVSAMESSMFVGTTASAISSSVASFSQSEPLSGVNGSDLLIILTPRPLVTVFEANPALLPSELPALSTSFADGEKPIMSRTSLRSSGLTISFSSTSLERTAVTASANASDGSNCPYCVFTCG